MKLGKNNILIFIVITLVLFFCVVLFFFFNDNENIFNNGDELDTIIVLGEEIQDSEGYVYKTVQVGEQVWMAENLKTTPEYGQSWCYSDQEYYCERYGRFYNWEAVMAGSQEAGVQGICPDGWYVPTDQDWYTLESSFTNEACDGSRLSWGCYPAGRFMKTETWGGDENSLFAVLPAGFIDRQGRSSLLNSYSYFWTSSKVGDGVWRRGFLESQSNILRTTENPDFGYSLRCIKE